MFLIFQFTQIIFRKCGSSLNYRSFVCRLQRSESSLEFSFYLFHQMDSYLDAMLNDKTINHFRSTFCFSFIKCSIFLSLNNKGPLKEHCLKSGLALSLGIQLAELYLGTTTSVPLIVVPDLTTSVVIHQVTRTNPSQNQRCFYQNIKFVEIQ